MAYFGYTGLYQSILAGIGVSAGTIKKKKIEKNYQKIFYLIEYIG